MKTAFQAISKMWKSLVSSANEAKEPFRKDGEVCMAFFNGPYNFLYGNKTVPTKQDFLFGESSEVPLPSVRITVNKMAEAVQLFGPSLYHRNPIREVTPRQAPAIPMELFGNPADPMTQMAMQPVMMQMQSQRTTDEARASLLEGLLNYLPVATDLKDHMRRGIDEAIIKGMGIWWTEVYRPVGSTHKIVGSFYDTVDNLLLDPDAESLEDAKWVGRRRCRPVWEVELEFGLAPGTLKGNRESATGAAASSNASDEWKWKNGKTNDLIVYFEIWSKMGMGGLLRGISEHAAEADQFGQYVYLAITDVYDYPLNLPEEIWNNPDEMYRRSQWQTPFWADDGWPFTPLIFHEVPRSIWPMSHFKPGLGELKFINWMISFIASKAQRASKDFVAGPMGMSEELINKILHGNDYEYLGIPKDLGDDIKKIVSFLQHPEFNPSTWQVLDRIMDLFDKRVGLTELMYGQTAHQFRSAAEADVKNSQMSIRPDDMANKVEDAASLLARKEAIAARWHLTGQDVGAVFGPPIGQLWDGLVASADLGQIMHQLQYEIQAGSARKRNRDKDRDDANQAMQNFFPFLSEYAMTTGNVGPINALIAHWGKAMDADVAALLLPAPPPMPPPAPAPAPSNGKNGSARNGKPQPAGV